MLLLPETLCRESGVRPGPAPCDTDAPLHTPSLMLKTSQWWELCGPEPLLGASARCWVLASPSPWGQTPEQSEAAWVIATPTLCFLPETYLRNLEEKLTQNKLILKEELRTLLHLCASRDDVELAKHVIYRWGTSLEYGQPFPTVSLSWAIAYTWKISATFSYTGDFQVSCPGACPEHHMFIFIHLTKDY